MLSARFYYNGYNYGLGGIALRRLAWLCGGFCGAIFLAHDLLPGAWLLRCVLAALALAVLSVNLGRQVRRRAVLCLLGAAFGFGWYALALRQIAPLSALPWEERTITACVTEYPRVYDDSASITVRITSPELEGLTARIADYDGFARDVRPGDEIRMVVKLRTGAVQFGEPSDAYLSRGIQLTGYLRQAPEPLGVWSGRWIYFPQELSHALVTRAGTLFPADVSAFAQALMLGEKQALYAENLDIPLRNAGIMHAVAVSGMHLAFLLGFFRLVGGRSRRAVLLTIPALFVFALVAGGTPSVLRAALMASLFLLAPLFGRETDGPTSLLGALAVLLAANPFSAGSVSLQLSFAALAGILAVTERLRERWQSEEPAPKKGIAALLHRVRRYGTATFATTVGAMLLTIPISALHFGTVALAAPLTNLLILWLLPTAFIGCYAAVLLSFAVPFLGKCLAWLIAWALRYVLLIARLLGGVRALQLSTQDHRIVIWLITVYVLFFASWLWKRLPRWKYAAAGALSVALLVLAVSLTRAESLRTPRVAAVDVGQGQCLVFCAGDETVMVDCGGGAKTDTAGDLAAQYLCAEQRRRVDTLFLTHLHEDHANGVCRLMLQIPVGRIVVPAAADPEGPELRPILDLAAEQGVEVVRLDADTEMDCGALHVRLFADIARETEDGSLLLRISYQDFDTLVTGDAPPTVELALLEQAVLADTELYIAGHHGSANASSDALLDALDARYAIISCGYNTYGHPAEETLLRLQIHTIKIYRTDLDGTVTVRME